MPRSKWQSVLDAVQLGKKRAEIDAVLKSRNVTVPGAMLGFGKEYFEQYHLDGEWTLTVFYQENGDSEKRSDKAVEKYLDWHLRPVWNSFPPEGYTGMWIFYYTNGQKCDETHCKDGKWNGKEVFYDEMGRVTEMGQYRMGKEIGEWTSYNRKGAINKKEEWFGEYIFRDSNDLSWEYIKLPTVYKHVITPVGEYISDSSGWRCIKKGTFRGLCTSSGDSTMACLDGDFKHPPVGWENSGFM